MFYVFVVFVESEYNNSEILLPTIYNIIASLQKQKTKTNPNQCLRLCLNMCTESPLLTAVTSLKRRAQSHHVRKLKHVLMSQCEAF